MSDDSLPEEDIITDSRGRHISRDVANELNTARHRVRAAVAAERMWRHLFTEEDRQRLGGDLETCWPRLGTIRMWMQARGVCLEQAVIEVALGLKLMSEETADWLRRELDLQSAPPKPPSDRPIWRADTGELLFEGRVIRHVRVLRDPSNIHQLLDAFEAAGWPARIDNVLPYGQQQLHETLRSLNRSLERIRFRSQGGGDAIIWERF